jgi:quinol monooxygenase YgiN
MIVIAGTIPINPAKRAEAEAACRAMSATCKEREPGCQAYEFSWDITATDTMRIFEIYDDAAALAAHMETEHFKGFGGQLGGLVGGAPVIVKYEVSSSGPLF